MNTEVLHYKFEVCDKIRHTSQNFEMKNTQLATIKIQWKK